MRAIIEGKLYDTAKAEEIVNISPRGFTPNDFQWEDTSLYRTSNGRFFIAGRGSALSRWRQSTGQNSWTNGSGIQTVSVEEAKALCEQHRLDPETYAELFGPPEEA